MNKIPNMGSYSSKDVVVELVGNDGNRIVVNSFVESEEDIPYTFLCFSHINGNEVKVPISKELFDEFNQKGFLNVK